MEIWIAVDLPNIEKQERGGDILTNVESSKSHGEFCFASVTVRSVCLVLDDESWTGGNVCGPVAAMLQSRADRLQIDEELLQPGVQ